MNHTPMTVRGAEKLRQELDYLKTELRPQIIEAIADAREHGDLKENAEYHAAKEEQGYLEAKIVELETQFASARILDESKLDTSKVGVLSKVEILNKKTNKKMVFFIIFRLMLSI